MLARCGEVYAHHWAHHGKRVCDPWWENETTWHRSWKELFPTHWQEVIQYDSSGEKHIADVKTESGWAVEFQHSYLNPGERRARSHFYKKLVWVVDGTRRKRDKRQLINAWNDAGPTNVQFIRRMYTGECTLLREWSDTSAPIFFDCGAGQPLWWLLGKGQSGFSYVGLWRREQLVQILLGDAKSEAHDFEVFVGELSKLIANYETALRYHR